MKYIYKTVVKILILCLLIKFELIASSSLSSSTMQRLKENIKRSFMIASGLLFVICCKN